MSPTTASAETIDHPLVSPEREAEFRSHGYWTDRSLAEIVEEHARLTPQKLAIAGDMTLTYEELNDRASRLAAGLAADVEQGDAVVALCAVTGWCAVLTLAVSRLGAVLAPLHPGSSVDRIAAVAEAHSAKVLIVDSTIIARDEWDEQAVLNIPSLRRRYVLDADELGSGFERAEALLESSSPLTAQHGVPGSVSLVISTSGTTGTPKGVLHSENTLLFSASCIAKGLRLTSEDVYIAMGAFGHGVMTENLYAPLSVGATVLPVATWDPVAVSLAVREHGATTGLLTATHVYDWLQASETHVNLHSLRACMVGGKPDHFFPDFEAATESALLRVWGMSECMYVSMDDADEPTGSHGVVFDGVEVQLVAPDGTASSRGTGEAMVRGAGLFLGFHNRPDLSEQIVKNGGWYHTGDLLEIDSNGIQISGRTKDLIRRGSLSIYPGEIESALIGHEDVFDVAVVGEPDERLGERIVAVVTPMEGRDLTLAEVNAFLTKAGLSKYSLPERLVVTEKIPKTALSKTDKIAVRGLVNGAK